jgi:hypothetical protein
VSVGENRALRELAFCRQEEKTSESRPITAVDLWLAKLEVVQKPSSGRWERKQRSVTAHFPEEDFWLGVTSGLPVTWEELAVC